MFGLSFGFQAMAIAVAVSLLTGGFGGGVAVRLYYRAEIAQGQARAARVDAKAGSELNDRANKTAEELSTNDATNDRIIRDAVTDKAKSNADKRCVLSDADARRLLELH